MSFGKLKSARKTKDLHSFVKADAVSISSTEQPTDSSTSASDHGTSGSVINTTFVDNDKAMQVEPPQQPQQVLQEEPVSKKPRLDGRSTGLVRAAVPVTSGDTSSKLQAYTADQRVREDTRPVQLHGCHASLPPSLEIRESQRYGRGIYAKFPFKAGSVILSITPHARVLSTPYLDQYCSSCAAPGSEAGLRRCQKCKTVYYCNQECQNRDWAWHKRECSALQSWASTAPSQDLSVPGDAIRCLGRILWGSQKEGLDSNWAREIRMMQSNRSSLRASSFESHTHLAHSLVRYLGVSSPGELEPYGLNSAGDLVDLISRFTTNTFTLTSFSLTPIGICVAPTVALANHSCDPNAVIVFPRTPGISATQEPLMNLVALRDIPSGKEVRIAYIDTTLPKHLRHQELKETYNFTCQCNLCKKGPATVDPREAMWCPKNCGGTCPLPTEEDSLSRCINCKAAVTNVDAVLDAVRVGQEALDKATSLQFKDPAKARQLTTNIIPILASSGLTPSSHPLLAMTHLHQELIIASFPSSLSQEGLDEVIRTAAKYSAGLQGLLPKGHPVRAVALGELGKLLAVDEPSPPSNPAAAATFPPSGPQRLKLAYESLVRAHEEMLIGFGKENQGGLVGRDVRDAIVRLEKELGVWTSGIKNALEDAVRVQRAK